MNGKQADKLLLLISEGDNATFEQLYLQTKRGVFAFLYTYFTNIHDAEDAMQTVYLKIKQNISSYKPGTNGRAWILQIAKNHALNEIAKKKRVDLVDAVEDTPYTPDDGSVMDAMKRALTEEEQRIITLHVLWGYKHREIADILGCPTGTVTSKYKRAIQKMQIALKEEKQ